MGQGAITLIAYKPNFRDKTHQVRQKHLTVPYQPTKHTTVNSKVETDTRDTHQHNTVESLPSKRDQAIWQMNSTTKVDPKSGCLDSVQTLFPHQVGPTSSKAGIIGRRIARAPGRKAVSAGDLQLPCSLQQQLDLHRESAIGSEASPSTYC